MPFPKRGNVPTWGLLAGAAITAWYAHRAFIAQGEKLAELKAEAAEQRRVNDMQRAVLERQQRDLANLTQRVVLARQQPDMDGSLRQRLADAAAARKAQASQVLVWTVDRLVGSRITSEGRSYYICGDKAEFDYVERPSFAVYIKNTSSQPIYDITIKSDLGNDDNLGTLMPDSFAVAYKPDGAKSADVEFRDARSALWTRKTSGRLIDRGNQAAG